MSYKATCPTCEWPIRRDNPPPDNDSITCPSCGEVYPPVWDTEEDSSESEKAPTPPVTPPPLPVQTINGLARYRVWLFDKASREMTYNQIIDLCKQRSLIDSQTLLCPISGPHGWGPIGEFPEFNNFVPIECIEREAYRIRTSISAATPADAECYLLRNNVQEGPYTPKQMQSMWNAGTITANSLFYHCGLKEWSPVKYLCEAGKPDASDLITVQLQKSNHLLTVILISIGLFMLALIFYRLALVP